MSEVVIDLHGYSWDEARQRFFCEYEALRTHNYFIELVVIHGVGSKPQSGIIKDRLRQLLWRHQDKLVYRRGEDIDGNPGRTIVHPRYRPWGGPPSPPIAVMTASGKFKEVRSPLPAPPLLVDNGLFAQGHSSRLRAPTGPQKGQQLQGGVLEEDGKCFARLEPSECLAEVSNPSCISAIVRSGASNRP